MDKNNIIDYVMHTPGNTNKAVLSSMLDSITQGGGGEQSVVICGINCGIMSLQTTKDTPLLASIRSMK